MHEPCGYPSDLVSSFDSKQNKHRFYREKDCIKRFCSDLKVLGTKIISYEEKELISLLQSFIKIKMKKMKFKLYKKVRDHCHYTERFRGAAHSIFNLNYKVPEEIHNGSKHDYHFLIKEFAEDFKGEFGCLGENTKKDIGFSVTINKENDNDKTTTYKIKFVDTCRFMLTELSDLVDNLSEIRM